MAERKKVLVMGGSGFIGKSLVPMLVSRGCDVTVLNRGNKPMERTTQLIADRNSGGEMEAASLLTQSFDAVIDTSAYTPMQTQIAWRYFSGKTNKWIHISSAAVYRDYETEIPHAESDETGGAEIWGAYGKDKSAIDSFLQMRNSGVRTIVIRPPYIYGPNNDVDRETFVWARAESGLPVVLPEKENTLMQFLHVEDLSDCICACVDHTFESNAVYNVGSDEIVTMREWVSLLLDVCARKTNAKVLRNTLDGYAIRTHFPFRDYPLCLNVEAIKKQINWQAKYDLREGFAQTYGTYTKQDLEKYLSKITNEEKELAAKLT